MHFFTSLFIGLCLVCAIVLWNQVWNQRTNVCLPRLRSCVRPSTVVFSLHSVEQNSMATRSGMRGAQQCTPNTEQGRDQRGLEQRLARLDGSVRSLTLGLRRRACLRRRLALRKCFLTRPQQLITQPRHFNVQPAGTRALAPKLSTEAGDLFRASLAQICSDRGQTRQGKHAEEVQVRESASQAVLLHV